MKRKITGKLRAWKNDPFRKPLLIYGARQIGKTYTMLAFGKSEYDQTVYLNFESSRSLAALFEKDLNPKRIISELEMIHSISIVPGRTLIIFDEIQACERALTFLKYLYEEANEYHLIAAGSLMGIALNRGEYSFPVGKTDRLNMYPMTFDEFLAALNQQKLMDAIYEGYECNTALSAVLHEKALDFYHLFLSVGGYPEAVARYLDKKDFDYVRGIQSNIAEAYIADMAKYALPTDTVRAMAAYNSLPSQLARENRKFMYSAIGSNARAKDYERAIQWLTAAGVVLKCHKVNEGHSPLSVYEDPLSFKMYFSDVGLLSMKAGISARKIVSELGLSDRLRGMLAENYVASELTAKGILPYYWTSGNTAEVDFVITLDDQSIPVEVKSSENVRAKSLNLYRKKYDPLYAIRISEKNFGFENGIKSVPLYAVFAIS